MYFAKLTVQCFLSACKKCFLYCLVVFRLWLRKKFRNISLQRDSCLILLCSLWKKLILSRLAHPTSPKIPFGIYKKKVPKNIEQQKIFHFYTLIFTQRYASPCVVVFLFLVICYSVLKVYRIYFPTQSFTQIISLES